MRLYLVGDDGQRADKTEQISRSDLLQGIETIIEFCYAGRRILRFEGRDIGRFPDAAKGFI